MQKCSSDKLSAQELCVEAMMATFYDYVKKQGYAWYVTHGDVEVSGNISKPPYPSKMHLDGYFNIKSILEKTLDAAIVSGYVVIPSPPPPACESSVSIKQRALSALRRLLKNSRS
jgi:hypothetical protein